MTTESERQEEARVFEDEVRRVARQLWPTPASQGAVMLDSREFDGYFETDECIHLIEATTSRTKDKAHTDLRKLAEVTRTRKGRHGKPVRCWFITKYEPTAEQRRVAATFGDLSLTVASLAEFQARLVNSRAYLSARENYFFGSVRDPETQDKRPRVDYIGIPLVDRISGEVLGVDKLMDRVLDGRRFLILGDYGAGKSMTLRELYYSLRQKHLRSQTPVFPVFVNLRDHWGQADPAEVMERHARCIGFENPHHLVRAWRAGYVVLLLDGFDELSGLAIQGYWKRFQQVRYRATEAIRRLVAEHPRQTGLVISGRAHYFDSEPERARALSVTSDFRELWLDDFGEEQVAEYLRRLGHTAEPPEWLPTRPLLVSYLAAKGLLGELENGSDDVSALGQSKGWDVLLRRICEREARIEAGIDGETVRHLLERLATKARLTADGIGPLTTESLGATFIEICGFEPDEKASVLLQRLPGLGPDTRSEQARSFIDEDLADACRAGDLTRFIMSPFTFDSHVFQGIDKPVGDLGTGLTAQALLATKGPVGLATTAVRQAKKSLESDLVALDVCRVALEADCGLDADCTISGALIPTIELHAGGADFSSLRLRDCYVGRLTLDVDLDEEKMPRFSECFIATLEGRSTRRELPSAVFDEACEVELFLDNRTTTHAILGMELPLPVRVLLSVMKKLYLQRGSGRKESAFFRGLDANARAYVAPVLSLIESEKLARRVRKGAADVWTPDRGKMARVGRILTSPTSSADSLVERCRKL